MATVIAGASMSVDGFIAGPGNSGFEHLFAWNGNGDVEVPTSHPDFTLRMTPQSAEHYRNYTEGCGAIVVGRRLFDMTKGWGGQHPNGANTFVVTHDAPAGWADNPNFTFVDGVAPAIELAKEQAGDRIVGVNGGTMARQALEAKLLDELWLDLVPVVLGAGTPFLDQLANVPVVLSDPEVIEGKAVTHLKYKIHYA
jgi:dihydrofolate reductase